MKIAICSSLDFIDEIKDTAHRLLEIGHEVVMPQTAEKIYNGEVTHQQIMEEKRNGEFANRGARQDSLRYYHEQIKNSDAILVLNLEKKGIEGYIGGAAFLEMGFAHVNNKKIFLLNEIPLVSYADEIKMMQPIVINGDLNLIS